MVSDGAVLPVLLPDLVRDRKGFLDGSLDKNMTRKKHYEDGRFLPKLQFSSHSD